MDEGKTPQIAKTKKKKRARELRENPFLTKTAKVRTEGRECSESSEEAQQLEVPRAPGKLKTTQPSSLW
ncbi:hypothetical protein TNCV_5118831 [Trichonephila clavipes]|nr:hypothetical protein TNCV_5118831 [Trichonephila clavipes]